MRIGIIGAGFAGRASARLAVQHGHDVMLSNSRDPQTLGSVMIRCQVGTNRDAASFGEIVLLMVPFSDYREIPADLLVGKIVMDATNYDPEYGGHITELDDHATTASELVAGHLAGAYVVKTLNAIPEEEMEKHARPSGSPQRRALPIAGNVAFAKDAASALLNQLGFDAVDAGPLSEGWRFEQGRPAWGVPLDSAGLRQALAAAGTDISRAAS